MVIIKIEDGEIRGKTSFDINNRQYYSFQGIPYAEPPIGSLRFKAPKPIKPWPGLKDCTKEGPESISKHLITRQMIGSEDCLHLNVYTPNLPQKRENSLKPVMFWIHGGIFITGCNKTDIYGPEFLVAEDVVLVIINYRLGYFGFISLDDPEVGVPGNAGLKDMVMALKWVQKSIRHFNGDPNNVTVFGESAGAVSAHLLMLSPMATGLLHKMIAQSGSVLNPWAYGKPSGAQIAAQLGFLSTDDRKILPFLQNVRPEELLKAQIVLDNSKFADLEYRTLGFVIERESNEEAFLTEHPLDIILSGNYNHVPIIMGYNWEEGIAADIFKPRSCRENLVKNTEFSFSVPFNLQKGSSISKYYAEQVRKFYYNSLDEITEKNKEYYSLCTDSSFLRYIYFCVKAHSKNLQKPLFFYRLKLDTELNCFKKLANLKMPGVCHADDLCYLFKTCFTPKIVANSIEDISRKRMTKMWTNFAKFGTPTPDCNNQLLNVMWTPIDKDDVHFLDISETLTMNKNPEAKRMKFWTELVKFSPRMSKI